MIPVSAIFNFLPMVVENIGGTAAQLGLLFFVRGISEVPAFLATRRAARSHRYILLVVSGALLYLLQLVLYTRVRSLGGLVAIQLLRGPAYALFLTGAVHYVRALAPFELKATAQAAARSLYQGAGGVAGSLGGGLIIEHFGLSSLFHTGIVLIGTGLVLFLGFLREQRASVMRRRRLAAARRGQLR